MTVTGFIAYAQGWGGLYIRANKLAWRQMHAHPGLGIPNRFGIPDCPERVHWEPEFALMVGVPGRLRLRPGALLLADAPSYQLDGRRRVSAPRHLQDPPPQSRRRHAVHRRQRRTSFIEDGRLVEIAQEAHNQDGELSVVGSGIVELPERQTA